MPSRELIQLLELAQQYGFEEKGLTKNGHVKFLHPNGGIVYASPHRSGLRYWNNVERTFRRVAAAAEAEVEVEEE